MSVDRHSAELATSDPTSGPPRAAKHAGEPESRRSSWLRIFFSPSFTLALTSTVVVTASVAIYSAVTLIFQDNGWSVVSAEVSTDRKVVIDHNLEVTRDFKLAGAGSVIEMTGVNCSAEERAGAGSGRLCFDRQSRQFRASTDGSEYVGLDGQEGKPGDPGDPGTPGQACWDLDGDQKAEVAQEDSNSDGRVDVLDCRASSVAGSGLLRKTSYEQVPAAIKHLIYRFTNDDVDRPLRSWAAVPINDPALAKVAQAGTINVQVTSENNFLQLFVYIDSKNAVIYVLEDDGAVGEFHYLIQPNSRAVSSPNSPR